MVGLSSCHDSKPTIYGNNLNFKAINLSVESDGQVEANSSSSIITTTVAFNITINRVLTSVRGESHYETNAAEYIESGVMILKTIRK